MRALKVFKKLFDGLIGNKLDRFGVKRVNEAAERILGALCPRCYLYQRIRKAACEIVNGLLGESRHIVLRVNVVLHRRVGAIEPIALRGVHARIAVLDDGYLLLS